MRISQSTNSLSLQKNEFHNDESNLRDENSREFIHSPEDEEDNFDDRKKPELNFVGAWSKCINRWQQFKLPFWSGIFRIFYSPTSRASDDQQETANLHQQVVCRKGQPTDFNNGGWTNFREFSSGRFDSSLWNSLFWRPNEFGGLRGPHLNRHWSASCF